MEAAEKAIREHFKGRKLPIELISGDHDGGWGPDADEFYFVSRIRWEIAKPILEAAGITDEWYWERDAVREAMRTLAG